MTSITHEPAILIDTVEPIPRQLVPPRQKRVSMIKGRPMGTHAAPRGRVARAFHAFALTVRLAPAEKRATTNRPSSAVLQTVEAVLEQEMQTHIKAWGNLRFVEARGMLRLALLGEDDVDLMPVFQSFVVRGAGVGAAARCILAMAERLEEDGVSVKKLPEMVQRHAAVRERLAARPARRAPLGTHVPGAWTWKHHASALVVAVLLILAILFAL